MTDGSAKLPKIRGSIDAAILFRHLEGVVTQRHVLERYREFGEG